VIVMVWACVCGVRVIAFTKDGIIACVSVCLCVETMRIEGVNFIDINPLSYQIRYS
jgi:hypothetical protein